MIKNLFAVALLVIGFIGIVRVIIDEVKGRSNIELMGFIFVVSSIMAITGAFCLGVAITTY